MPYRCRTLFLKRWHLQLLFRVTPLGVLQVTRCSCGIRLDSTSTKISIRGSIRAGFEFVLSFHVLNERNVQEVCIMTIDFTPFSLLSSVVVLSAITPLLLSFGKSGFKVVVCLAKLVALLIVSHVLNEEMGGMVSERGCSEFPAMRASQRPT